MQISRMFEIVYLLLDGGRPTAASLAERFEVSSRTILRDVEALAEAGMPVYAERGRGGGIRLMEGFVLSKSLLTKEDQREVLAALQGFAATRSGGLAVLGRLSALWGGEEKPWIDVDFSEWSQDNRRAFNEIKAAILSRKPLRFDYYASNGEMTSRTVEPRLLWFKHRAWYLLAFCRARRAERLFRLTRIKRLQTLDEAFHPRGDPPAAEPPPEAPRHPPVTVTLRFDAPMYRVWDEFDEQSIQRNADGSVTATATFPEDDWVYGFILSFGPRVEVIGPPHVRAAIQDLLQKNLALYHENRTR